MGKLLENVGSVILGVLIFLLLLSIMIFMPAVLLNYILLKLGIAVSFWVSVAIIIFIYLIAVCIKNI